MRDGLTWSGSEVTAVIKMYESFSMASKYVNNFAAWLDLVALFICLDLRMTTVFGLCHCNLSRNCDVTSYSRGSNIIESL